MFLVWTSWTGEEVGEGDECIIARVELLPTPRISSFNALARRPYASGVFPEGSIIVDQISCGAYTDDVLKGLRIPRETTSAPRADVGMPVNDRGNGEVATSKKVDFWWEITEDGRGDNPSERKRFRVFGDVERKEGSLYFAVTLQAADEPLSRTGKPQIGVNDSDINLAGFLE